MEVKKELEKRLDIPDGVDVESFIKDSRILTNRMYKVFDNPKKVLLWNKNEAQFFCNKYYKSETSVNLNKMYDVITNVRDIQYRMQNVK